MTASVGPSSHATATAPAPAPRPKEQAPARRPGLRIAAVPGRRSLWRIFGTATLVLLFAAVLGVVVFQTLLVQTQSRLDELDAQMAVQEQLADQHRLELAELEAPGRIVQVATERLGMVPPSEVLYLPHEPGDDAAAAGSGPVEGTASDASPVSHDAGGAP